MRDYDDYINLLTSIVNLITATITYKTIKKVKGNTSKKKRPKNRKK